MPLSKHDALEMIAMHISAVSGGKLHQKDLQQNTPMASAWMFHAAVQVADAKGWHLKKAANDWTPGMTLDQFLRRYRRN